jgi:iron complex outermembrane receptor protein
MRNCCRTLCLSLGAALLIAGTLTFADADARSISYDLNIPSEDLTAALQSFAIASHHKLLYKAELTAGKTSRPLKGHFTAQEAVEALLSGTGLTYEITGSSVVLIKGPGDATAALAAASTGQSTPQNASPGPSDGTKEAGKTSSQDFRVAQLDQTSAGPQAVVSDQSSEKKKQEALTEIVVTGTHIRGESPIGSRLDVYTRKDLDQSGAGTLDQFARQMPGNLTSVDTVANVSSTAQSATLYAGDTATTGGVAFNLNGLGVASTLTLLNGHRLAASGDNGSFVDISLIPFSAVDRVEVLEDGSSAIYGSDAVGGVVNIIMRKDFSGAESSVRYGGATDSGATDLSVSQLFGTTWGSGNAMLSYEYDRQGGLDSSQRGYIPDQGGPDSLIPSSHRNSVFFSGRQDIDSATTLSVDAIYAHRNNFATSTLNSEVEMLVQTIAARTDLYGISISVDRAISEKWHASITANYSGTTQSYESPFFFSADGSSSLSSTVSTIQTSDASLDALIGGALFPMPGGDVKLSVGGTFRAQDYSEHYTESADGAAFSGSVPYLKREIDSGFGELLVPLVGRTNSILLISRLDLSLAARYDHYSDFGSTTNPKVGLLWQPIETVNVRGSYGKSFQAPLLTQIGEPPGYSTNLFVNPAGPGGYTDTLQVTGGNPNLRPQTATNFSAGLDWRPAWAPALRVSATYLNIDYTNRIGLPPVANYSTVFSTPYLAPFLNLNPTPDQVQAAFKSGPLFQGDFAGLGPSGVTAIFDERFANLAEVRESKLNWKVSYDLPIPVGHLSVSALADYLIDDRLKAVTGSQFTSIVNTFADPPRWRAQAGASWSQSGVTSALKVNYTGSYTDNLMTPSGTIGSWSTVDLYLGYKPPVDTGPAALQGLSIALSVQNIANKRPPYVEFGDLLPGQNPIPFDPVNASPIGRLVALQLTKVW